MASETKMKIRHSFGIGALVLTLGVPVELAPPVPASAASDTAMADPGQQQYVRDYVDAINSGDPERLKALIDPRARVCINEQTREFFDEMFGRAVQRPLTGTYRIERVVALDKDKPSIELPVEMFSYPVPPTHEIQVTFKTGPYQALTLIRGIVLSNGRWLEATPCPTAKGLEAFRKAKLAREARQVRAKELVGKLDEPLLSELRELVKQQKTIEAAKRYSAATGEDLTMAREVVDLIESRSP